MKTGLASLFIAVAAFAAATTGTTTPARAASEFAWCAFESTNGGGQSCTYNTVDQCRAYLAGRGFCQPNPRASAMAEMPKRSKRH